MSVLKIFEIKKWLDDNFSSDVTIGGHIGYKFHQINTTDSDSNLSYDGKLQDEVGYTFTMNVLVDCKQLNQ